VAADEAATANLLNRDSPETCPRDCPWKGAVRGMAVIATSGVRPQDLSRGDRAG
jgi:hypothetical protein